MGDRGGRTAAAGRPGDRGGRTAAAHTTTWTYDSAGRESSTSVDGKLLAGVERDLIRRRVVITDYTGADGLAVEHRLEYDRRGQLTSRTRGGRGMSWEYDADGNRTGFTDAHGTTTTYIRDAAGRVTAVRNPRLGEAVFTHDASGRITSATAGDLVQEWAYRYGSLSEHSRTDRNDLLSADATLIGRDGDGRITALTRAGAVTRYGYDGAGQMVSAATTRSGDPEDSAPASVSEWVYDAGGRPIRKSTPAGSRTYEYDAAGQLLAVTDADGSRTEYVHDGLGRRTRLILPDGSWTEYAWGQTGHLKSAADRTPDGMETSRHELWVDALGELAAIDGVELWWDTANPIPALAGFDGEQVLSLPGGVTGIGEAWTAPGWRAARPTDQTDPWAVIGAPSIPDPGPGGTPGAGAAGWGAVPELAGELPAGITLTGNGGLDIAGLEWLGARAYDPATRGFLSTDPLSPVLGAGWDGNPYAYAGNNPLNTTDPTGLRPLTDDELKAYDGSSRGAFAAAGNWVKDNWEYVVGGLAVVGGAVLMFVPGGQVAGLGLMSFGADVVIQKATTGEVNWGQAAISGGLGMVGGGVGMMAGKLVNNPVVRMAVENGVDGAISGAGGYLTGPGPHTPTGFIRATAISTGTGALPIGGRAGKVDVPPSATTKLGDLPPTLEGMRGNPAANFTDGAYKSRYLSEDTILYRGGEAGNPWGRWWSEDAPISVEQVRNDKAVLPEWPGGGKSPIDSAFMARFPAGTAVHEGMTAPQTGLDGTIYPGGTPQVYIPDARTAGEILKEWKLD